jgi:hypothetical protein
VCLSVWNVAHGTPAALAGGANTLRRFQGSIGVPAADGNTSASFAAFDCLRSSHNPRAIPSVIGTSRLPNFDFGSFGELPAVLVPQVAEADFVRDEN